MSSSKNDIILDETIDALYTRTSMVIDQAQEMKSNRDKVIYILSKNSKITLEEIAQIVGLSRIGIQKIVGKLKSEGILSRRGSTKAGEWVVVNNELKK